MPPRWRLKTNLRLLGVVENMSCLVGTGQELFGSGGGDALAAELGKPVLGRIPFDPELGAYCDRGEPIVLAEPEAEVSRAITELAEAIVGTERERGVGIVKPLPLVEARQGRANSRRSSRDPYGGRADARPVTRV